MKTKRCVNTRLQLHWESKQLPLSALALLTRVLLAHVLLALDETNENASIAGLTQ